MSFDVSFSLVASQTYTVPINTASIKIVAIGAGGGRGKAGVTGGNGAVVITTYNGNFFGDTLTINIGRGGSSNKSGGLTQISDSREQINVIAGGGYVNTRDGKVSYPFSIALYTQCSISYTTAPYMSLPYGVGSDYNAGIECGDGYVLLTITDMLPLVIYNPKPADSAQKLSHQSAQQFMLEKTGSSAAKQPPQMPLVIYNPDQNTESQNLAVAALDGNMNWSGYLDLETAHIPVVPMTLLSKPTSSQKLSHQSAQQFMLEKTGSSAAKQPPQMPLVIYNPDQNTESQNLAVAALDGNMNWSGYLEKQLVSLAKTVENDDMISPISPDICNHCPNPVLPKSGIAFGGNLNLPGYLATQPFILAQTVSPAATARGGAGRTQFINNQINAFGSYAGAPAGSGQPPRNKF